MEVKAAETGTCMRDPCHMSAETLTRFEPHLDLVYPSCHRNITKRDIWDVNPCDEKLKITKRNLLRSLLLSRNKKCPFTDVPITSYNLHLFDCHHVCKNFKFWDGRTLHNTRKHFLVSKLFYKRMS